MLVLLPPSETKSDGGKDAPLDLAELSITSGATLTDEPAPADAYTLAEVPGVWVVIKPATGEKCGRCWQVLPDVGTAADHPELCGRCAAAVEDKRTVAE